MTPKREGFELVHVERLLSHSGGNSTEYMAPVGALLVREGNNFYVFVPKKAKWTGEGPPPVGTKVTIETCGLRIWEEAEMFVGPVVEVVSTFKLINSDMVVVYLEDENACCVFRASMCRMPKTPAQLAAEEREKAIEFMMQMTSSLGHSDVSKKILFGELYDKGLRFEVKP